MKKVFGLGIAALALALASVDARAQTQNTVATTASPPPASTDVVGPAQLRDFDLNGTVTRRPDPQPDAAEPRGPRQTETPDPVSTATAQPARSRSPRQDSPAGSLARTEGAPRAGRQPDVVLPPATPAPAPVFTAPLADSAPLPVADPSSPGFGLWPWLLAALAAAGAAAFYFWRQRSQPAYAGAGMAFEAQPEVAPIPATSPPSKPPVPDAPRVSPSGGIVSSRIRPWLEIEFTPARCIYSDNGAVIEFEASLYNSGGAPARDVLLEARLFNASQSQDEEVSAFFAHPHGEGNRIAEIRPLSRLSVKSAVSLNREQLRAYRLEERLLWVPAIGFTALYRWSGGNGQTSSSFILGRETKGDKMAAFRLDQGSRVFRGIGARPHTVGVRK